MKNIIQSQMEEISPDLAKKYLEKNIKNRSLRHGVVRKYAESMKRGEWKITSAAISFDYNGILTNGQHTLHAIIESGVTIKRLVVRGLEPESFQNEDIGKNRCSGDIFSIHGIKNSNSTASIAKLIYIHRLTGNPYHGAPESIPSTSQLLDLYYSDPDIESSAHFTTKSSFLRKLIRPSISGFCYYIFSKKNKDMADNFFNELIDGDYSYKNSPVKLLRDALALDLGSKRKISSHYKCSLIFKAFSIYLKGNSIKT